MLPLLVFLAAFMVYPTLELVQLGFSTVTPSGGEFMRRFSGLRNLRTMLGDEIFRASLVNTVVFVLAAAALQLILGTMLAVLAEKARFVGGLARNVLLWPAIVTPVAVSVTWFLILNIEFGLLNNLLRAVGLPTQAWLASETWALPALVVVDVWHWTPLVFLLVLAGLANIDRSLYEAARMDGASGWKVFRHITLPLLAPTLAVAFLVRLILGFKVFDEIYLLTSGGPGTSTEVVSTRIQQVFYDEANFGYGAFLGVVVVAVFVLGFMCAGLVRFRRRPAAT